MGDLLFFQTPILAEGGGAVAHCFPFLAHFFVKVPSIC